MEDIQRAQLNTIAEQHLAPIEGCHGIDHTVRVVRLARQLARHYPAVNGDVLEAAAWLHDIGRGTERPGVSHAVISAELARDVLPTLGFSVADMLTAVQAIADHRYSSGQAPSSLEGRLLQDADWLDALGAIGIARTYAAGGERALYHAADPLAQARTPDDSRYTLDHFFTKLLRLPATLHTPEARALAERRVRFLELFVSELLAEIADE